MKQLMGLFVILAVLFVGCGEDDTIAPTVESTNPANGATGVSVSTTISVTFDEPMHAGTVQANYNDTQPSGTVQLSSDNFVTCVRFAGGTVSNENSTYTFTPILDLTANTVYAIKITTGVTDAAGNAMESEYTASFTTQ